MVDASLAKEIKEMYDIGKVGEKPENLLKIYEFVKQISAESNDLKEELEDMDAFTAQISITDPEFKTWLKIGDGKFEYGKGEADDPSFTLSCNYEIMGGMMAGEIDSTSAYMSGDLTIEGNLQDAIAYGEYLSLAMEVAQDLGAR